MSRADIAASFQRTAVLHLEERCERAIQWALKMEPSIRHLVVSGGVASNQYVRARLDMVAKKNGLQLLCPPPRLCTDNGNNFFLILLLFVKANSIPWFITNLTVRSQNK
ncbi:hypothetical protein VIGAN_UM004300 [Vigna angularis var. angularis]|uniref:Gcp-like domain-containing protein n=1 Tax=Vigna angularis var. angularis TaxID=157739 RepID=A0A0S3TDA7_PHAAN|nr:hypothetical protein VIGAN_UM004300 [Vigna angularis var. angularis]